MKLRNMALYAPPTLFSALLVVGCGGGGDSTDSTTTAANSVVASGEITGFGSIYVNGKRYNTDNAEIYRDGDQLNDDRELSLGMIVRVEGELEDGAYANKVYYEELVKGPVDTVDSANSQMMVMGQTVHTDAGTVFDDGITLADFTSGDIAEISGLPQADGSIRATYVEKKTGTVDEYEVIGKVSGLDTNAMSFMLGNLAVSYASADVNDLPNGAPAEGMLVEVEDGTQSYVANALTLNASKVEPIDRFEGMDHDDELEIEGIVQDASGLPDSFVMNDITVLITADTEMEFGDISLIKEGVHLEVEGYLDDSGTQLVADEIEFEDHDARISATVSSVDSANGIIGLLGDTLSVYTTESTEYDDERDENPGFGLDSITIDDYLNIRGYQGTEGQFIATRIEREETKSEVELRAVVENPQPVAQTFELAGLQVKVDGNTEFELDDDIYTDMAQFFEALTPGLSVVEASWDNFTDLSQPADKAEIED